MQFLLGNPLSQNIARGTTDPCYWVRNWSYFIGCKFGHQMVPVLGRLSPADWAPCRFAGKLGPALFRAQFAVFRQIRPRQIGPQQIGPRQIGPLANWAPADWAPVFHIFVLDIYCQQFWNICLLVEFIYWYWIYSANNWGIVEPRIYCTHMSDKNLDSFPSSCIFQIWSTGYLQSFWQNFWLPDFHIY